MNKHLKQFLTGLVVGLVCPFLGLFVYWFFTWRNLSFIPGFFKFMYDNKQIGNHFALAVLVNLPIFYILLNREKYKFAQGVLFATIAYAMYVFYYKLFVHPD